MLQIFMNSGAGEIDYTRYVTSQSISITRNLNAPSTCSLSLSNNDGAFVLPCAMSYLRIYSTKYQKNLYTGFLQNDPATSFLGMSNRVPNSNGQMYSFALSFTSDEYLLNIKSVPFLPAFVNQSQGQILRTIAEALCPGFFDFTYCASGDIVPYMAYDSTQNWSQIAKTLGDASRYRYSVVNKEIHFQPYGDGELGIAYDEDAGEGKFDPSQFQVTPQSTPVVNDVTIIGQQEAGNNHEDFFIGDGFTGAFPLKHKVFGLADSEQGSGVLLADSWSETTLNTQNWQAQDPSNNFYYGSSGSSALNILTGQPQPHGTSFIAANSGLELAGGLSIQHGEVVFNDFCSGIIGGIYDTEVLNGYGDLSLDEQHMEAGFLIQPTANVVVTASGASGITIQPYRQGQVPVSNISNGASGAQLPAFKIVTQVNKSYVMFTNITAPAATRYTQVYRTLAGVAYGSVDQSSIQGTINWSVTETDLFTGVQTFYNFSMANQTLPPTAIYALVDNWQLNVTIQTTQITAPIPGSLHAKCEIGAGALAPIYISGNVQYTGAFVTPSGGNLPILPNDFGPENNFPMGSGLGQQAAELDSGQVTDTLNFYSDDLPGVGVRLRLQTFESQAAISRVRNAQSVAAQAAIVGDDGVRSTIVTNLSPEPRTSEDCDLACQAYLADRTKTLYNGTYNAQYYFFNQFTDDIDFFPTCGRFLYVHSPQRNIWKQKYLVSSITTNVTELRGEIMTHSITFGADMQITKLLAAFIPTNTSVLTPLDTIVQPPPQTLEAVGTTYLPDVNQTSISAMISGAQLLLDLNDAIPPEAFYEIRNADLNWGIYPDSRLIGRYGVTGSIILPRLAYDQSWYIRLVSLRSGSIQSSRRTKVIRVVYPRVPTLPVLTYGESDRLQFDFSGDVRNIEGIKLSSGNGATGYYEAIVGSEEDMNLDLTLLRGQGVIGESVSGNLGVYQLMTVPANQRNFLAQFFNLMWELGPGLYVNIPPPLAPVLSLGYRFGPAIQLIVVDQDNPARPDIQYTTLQIANSSSFTPASMLFDGSSNGNPGSFVCNVPVTGAVWCRAQFTDFISSGAWSNTVHVPLGDIIASDYMVGQGSVPPAITNNTTAPGGLFTYVGYANLLELYSAPFSILWPNQTLDTITATSGIFGTCIDVTGSLTPDTSYGFFPKVLNPSTPNPTLSFNGPYANYAGANVLAALSGQFQDGSVPMTNGVFVCQTSDYYTGQTGGGGGGTDGGGNCGVLSSIITMQDGSKKTLADLCMGDIVKTRTGRGAKVHYKAIMPSDTYLIRCSEGLSSRAALSHTLDSGEWKPISKLIEDLADGKIVYVATPSGSVEVLSIDSPSYQKICKIELRGLDPNNKSDDDHVYLLDGIWTHNNVIKNPAVGLLGG